MAAIQIFFAIYVSCIVLVPVVVVALVGRWSALRHEWLPLLASYVLLPIVLLVLETRRMPQEVVGDTVVGVPVWVTFIWDAAAMIVVPAGLSAVHNVVLKKLKAMKVPRRSHSS